MEIIPQIPLLQVSREDVDKIRRDYDLNTKKINESVDAIEEWCKKQDHLQEALQYFNRGMFERMLLLSRGSIERTKNKIDKILTTRGFLPEIVRNKSIEEFENFSKKITIVMLPNLSPVCQSRIFVSQITNKNIDDINLLTYMRYLCLIGEYRLHYEYSIKDRYIVDLKNINLNVITKLNPMLMKKAELLCTEVYGMKITGMHFLNAPPFINKIISIFKQAFKEKLWRRIHVHNSYEELQNEIPKELIPKDYGGEAPSCAELAEQWKEYLKTDEARRVQEIANKLKSDESKRCSTKFNEEYLGMLGTFRTLNVD